jgi:D-aminopeptidase
MTRARLRDLGITIGRLPSGPHNAITDVPGILVGHRTLIYDEPRIARTGVTVIVPRQGQIWQDNAFAACHAFNGTGEMTGMHWLAESGLLCYPIALTNTHQVGTVHEALVAYGMEKGLTSLSSLAIVAETWDGFLNDLNGFHVKKEDVYLALGEACSGPVSEGNVGGGTGMICHDFKGGIGTASRLVEAAGSQYTVGVLVQANHGDRMDLRLEGIPVGRLIGADQAPLPDWDAPASSSIIIIVATDAPLLPVQCHRLAKRATIGLARAGGIGHNGSGDIFLAFATGNHLPGSASAAIPVAMLPHHLLNDFFAAVAEATEEAIWNALTAADTMVGRQGRVVHAIPLDQLENIWRNQRYW